MLYALLLALTASADAGTLAGVTLSDSATVGGQPLVLNGLGLREKYFIDIYVGGLYLPAKSTDADAIIRQDTAKRVVMHFIYDGLEREQLVETFHEGLANYPQYAGVSADLDRLVAGIGDVSKGDEIIVDYVPGAGTTITVKGVPSEPIGDAQLMELVWSMFIGSKPATEKLKAGMLGKK
jgi:hypothetical protein